MLRKLKRLLQADFYTRSIPLKIYRFLTKHGQTKRSRRYSWWLQRLIPQDPKLIIFGASAGRFYTGATRYLFEWLVENKSQEARCLWMTRSPRVYRELKSQGLPVCQLDTIGGLLTVFKAKACVNGNALTDLIDNIDLFPNRLPMLYVDHGFAIRKTMMQSLNNTPSSLKTASQTMQHCHYAIAPSEFLAELEHHKIGVPLSRIKITGSPSMDALLSVTEQGKKAYEAITESQSFKYTIAYMPTKRPYDHHVKLFPFTDFKQQDFEEFLKQQQILVLMRLHVQDSDAHYQAYQEDKKRFSSDNIKFVEWEQLNEAGDILPFCDVLITDYSSLLWEFSILNRPILLFPYDYEEMDKRCGFTYDYFELSPGPMIKSYAEFKAYLMHLLEGKDPHQQQRLNIHQLGNQFTDGKSCQRIWPLLTELLQFKARKA